MYYVSADPLGEGAIHSATSDDGLAFTPEAGVRLRPGPPGSPDEGGIIHLSIVRRPNGGYRLYYDAVGSGGGGGSDWRGVRSARSMDGLTWRKDRGYRIRAGRSPIGFADLVWSPFVERSGRRYKLYFSLETDRKIRERVGIYLATSRYGLDFTIHAEHPVLGLDPKVTYPRQGEGGMTGLPQDAFVIRVDGGRRLFYWQAKKWTLSAFLVL